MSRYRSQWDQNYYEAWAGLVLMLALYVNGLYAGWVHWPWR